jgi:hypothetical protein
LLEVSYNLNQLLVLSLEPVNLLIISGLQLVLDILVMDLDNEGQPVFRIERAEIDSKSFPQAISELLLEQVLESGVLMGPIDRVDAEVVDELGGAAQILAAGGQVLSEIGEGLGVEGGSAGPAAVLGGPGQEVQLQVELNALSLKVTGADRGRDEHPEPPKELLRIPILESLKQSGHELLGRHVDGVGLLPLERNDRLYQVVL